MDNNDNKGPQDEPATPPRNVRQRRMENPETPPHGQAAEQNGFETPPRQMEAGAPLEPPPLLQRGQDLMRNAQHGDLPRDLNLPVFEVGEGRNLIGDLNEVGEGPNLIEGGLDEGRVGLNVIEEPGGVNLEVGNQGQQVHPVTGASVVTPPGSPRNIPETDANPVSPPGSPRNGHAQAEEERRNEGNGPRKRG